MIATEIPECFPPSPYRDLSAPLPPPYSRARLSVPHRPPPSPLRPHCDPLPPPACLRTMCSCLPALRPCGCWPRAIWPLYCMSRRATRCGHKCEALCLLVTADQACGWDMCCLIKPGAHSPHSATPHIYPHLQVYSFPLFDLLEMWLDGVAAPAAAAARAARHPLPSTLGAQHPSTAGATAADDAAGGGGFQRPQSNNVLTEARLRSKVRIPPLPPSS